MVRTKVVIKLIEDRAKRHTTFTKRRQGLMKKAQDFAAKFDAHAVVITFSKAGNVFAFGHPDVGSVVSRYLADHPFSESAVSNGGGGVEEEEEDDDETAAEGRIGRAMKSGVWESAVEGLDLPEVDELSEEIVNMRCAVAARLAEIAAEWAE